MTDLLRCREEGFMLNPWIRWNFPAPSDFRMRT